jgi:hypothetical protein
MAELQYSVYVAPPKLVVSDDSPQARIARCGPRPLQRSFTVSGTRS